SDIRRGSARDERLPISNFLNGEVARSSNAGIMYLFDGSGVFRTTGVHPVRSSGIDYFMISSNVAAYGNGLLSDGTDKFFMEDSPYQNVGSGSSLSTKLIVSLPEVYNDRKLISLTNGYVNFGIASPYNHFDAEFA